MTAERPADVATTLDDLLDVLSDAVVATGVPQVLLARDTGMSQKHVSRMLTRTDNGSLAAWQDLLNAAGLIVEITVRQEAVGDDHA